MINSMTQSKWSISGFSQYAMKLTGSLCYLLSSVYCTGKCQSRAHGQGVQEISHERQPTSKIGRDSEPVAVQGYSLASSFVPIHTLPEHCNIEVINHLFLSFNVMRSNKWYLI